jgi:hypothetical protein
MPAAGDNSIGTGRRVARCCPPSPSLSDGCHPGSAVGPNPTAPVSVTDSAPDGGSPVWLDPGSDRATGHLRLPGGLPVRDDVGVDLSDPVPRRDPLLEVVVDAEPARPGLVVERQQPKRDYRVHHRGADVGRARRVGAAETLRDRPDPQASDRSDDVGELAGEPEDQRQADQRLKRRDAIRPNVRVGRDDAVVGACRVRIATYRSSSDFVLSAAGCWPTGAHLLF